MKLLEKTDKEIIEAYKLLAESNPQRVFCIDASGTSEQVFEIIISTLESQDLLQ